MLNKLLDYEFRATRRTFGGIYLALALVSAALGLLSHHMLQSAPLGQLGHIELETNGAAGISAAVLSLAYFAILVALGVLTVLTIVERFHKNLLGYEGYLMHTLPVTPGQLIASKLISGLAWVLISMVMVGLTLMLILGLTMVGYGEMFSYLLQEPQAGLQQAFSTIGVSPFLLGAAALCMILSGCASTILCVYAACMIGHQLPRWHLPAGIAAFFALGAAQSWICGAAAFVAGVLARGLGIDAAAFVKDLNVNVQLLLEASGTVLICALFGTVYFLLARWLLQNRLNLE